jgi:type I restriction enzyme M protein
MRPQEKNIKDKEVLQKETFYGKELKSLPFILGTMNMMLNGIATPNIRKMNTLSINLFNLSEKYDIILTNPPFSGTVRGIESNFPYPSAQTEILFLQHCLRSLKEGGKCAIVFPEGVMFENQDAAYVNTKKELLQQFNLHHIVRLPKGAFAPYTPINTNILFFDKTGPTEEVHYYELPILDGRKNFTKTKPIDDLHFEEIKKLWDKRDKTENSWIVPVGLIEKRNYSLDFHHPDKNHLIDIPSPNELDNKIEQNISNLESLIKKLREEYLKTFQSTYATHSLKDLLIRSKERFQIEDSKHYKRVTIKMHGRGIVKRDEISGSSIGTKTQFYIRGGQLLMSKIDARNGAFGIVPSDLDGSIITGNFWAYKVNDKVIDSEYFHFLTQTNSFLNFCIQSSRGATNRQYLEEDLFLAQKVSIPEKISDQKEIVKNTKALLNNMSDLIRISDDLKLNIDTILPAYLENVLGKAFNGEA